MGALAMTRAARALVLACILALVGCTDASTATVTAEAPMGSDTQNAFADIAPWHMWGSSQLIEFTVVHVSNNVTQSVQLAKINYKRPESWRFLMFARIVSSQNAVPAPGPADLTVNFNVTTGVGRVSFSTPKFPTNLQIEKPIVQFDYQIPAGVVPGQQLYNTKYTSVGRTPPLSDLAVATSPVEPIEVIVGEDIQCNAQVTLLQPAQFVAGDVLVVELGAFFAPNVHVRPDWMADDADRAFLGNETGGT